MWLLAFLEGLRALLSRPVHLLMDNEGANALANIIEYYSRSKHIHGRQRVFYEIVE